MILADRQLFHSKHAQPLKLDQISGALEEIKQVSINRQLLKGIPIKSQWCPGFVHTLVDASQTFNLKSVFCIYQNSN